MHRVIAFLLVLCISAQASAEMWSEDLIAAYEAESCSNPKNADRWGIRRPTPDEIELFGNAVLIFEYWNSVRKCSDDFYGGVWFEGHRFMMEVTVGDERLNHKEQIRLELPTEDPGPFHIPDGYLMLDDGEEPGIILIYMVLS